MSKLLFVIFYFATLFPDGKSAYISDTNTTEVWFETNYPHFVCVTVKKCGMVKTVPQFGIVVLTSPQQ